MRRTVVVDTNVVVGALLTREAAGPLARVLDGMLSAQFSFALSPALLHEFRVVLARPKLAAAHGLSGTEIDTLLEEIVFLAVWRAAVEGASAVAAPDRGDRHVWDLLASLDAGLLVTGDQRLLEAPPPFAPVVGVRAFCTLLDAASATP